MSRCVLLESLKLWGGGGVRAALNCRKFKVALNLFPRILFNFKLGKMSALQNLSLFNNENKEPPSSMLVSF